MSRIGRKPVPIPSGVTVAVNHGLVSVKGPKGMLQRPIPEGIEVKVESGQAVVRRQGDDTAARSLHGLARNELMNMVIGVTQGYSKVLEISGVGYRAQLQGRSLQLSLGHSHPIRFDLPPGIEASVDKQVTVTLRGYDKYLVGQVAAQLRALRKPEPYKGKGIRYADEHVRRKEGKTGK